MLCVGVATVNVGRRVEEGLCVVGRLLCLSVFEKVSSHTPLQYLTVACMEANTARNDSLKKTNCLD